MRGTGGSSVVYRAGGHQHSHFHVGSQSHQHVRSSLQVHGISALLDTGQGGGAIQKEAGIGLSTVPA